MIFNNQGVQGADISFWQDNNSTPQQIDFTKMVVQGADWVTIRAGQNAWVDPDFSYNWTRAKQAGLPRGAYWFYDSRYDPIKQAELCASLFVNDKPEVRLWLDLEETYGGVYAGYANWKKFLIRFHEFLPTVRLGIYTGYYYILGKIPASEATFFAQFPLWIAWYTSNSSDVKIPYPWTSAEFWQWGTPPWGIAWGCESTEIDMNLFNGTLSEFQQRFGIIPSIQDGYSKINRKNTDIYIWRGSLTEKIVHVTNTHGELKRVSDVAQGSLVAINADGWIGGVNTPLSLAASDGILYQPRQYDFRPWINFSKDNKITVDFKYPTEYYNLFSGVRYIVKDGNNTLSTSTNPEHISELRPRTAAGITKDGKLILVVAGGWSSDSYLGITLKELGDIMIEAGAWMAFDCDGGRSSGMAINGKIVNLDPLREDSVVNHLVIYGGTMPNYYEIIGNDGNNHRVRTSYDVRSAVLIYPNTTNLVNITNTIKGYSGATPADEYIYPADVPDVNVPGGYAARAGDKWRAIYKVGTTNLMGWTAVVHLGVTQGITITPITIPTENSIEVIITESGIVKRYKVTGGTWETS